MAKGYTYISFWNLSLNDAHVHMLVIFTLSGPVAPLWLADMMDLSLTTADLGDERTGDLGAATAFTRSSLSNLTLRVGLSRGEAGTLDIAMPFPGFLTPSTGAAEGASPLNGDDLMGGS